MSTEPRRKKQLGDWKRRKADYIRVDPEVDDLVGQLNRVMIVAGDGTFDLDNTEPVLVALTFDTYTGERPKAALAISQDKYETRNSIVNRADDLLRIWYLNDNKELVHNMMESGKEYDEGWEAMVWDLPAAAVNEALSRLDDSAVDGVVVDRDFG
jgi:hypothetical protein